MRFNWPQSVTDGQDKDFIYELTARLEADNPDRDTLRDKQRAKLERMLRDI